jgi:hypothetical protein
MPLQRGFFLVFLPAWAGRAGQIFAIRTFKRAAAAGATEAPAAEDHADGHERHGNGDNDDSQYNDYHIYPNADGINVIPFPSPPHSA